MVAFPLYEANLILCNCGWGNSWCWESWYAIYAICSKTFKLADSLKTHESTVHSEAGEEIFVARQCSKCLSAHRLHHHLVCSRGKDGRVQSHHQCLVCLEVFLWCDTYWLHYDKHSLEEVPKYKAFQWATCFKLYASKKTLEKHNCTVDAKDEPKILTHTQTHTYDTI